MEERRSTKQWKIEQAQATELDEAAQCLRAGKLIAFPTETVYGLGANAMDEAAVAGIFQAKGRPADNPLIVHVGSRDIVEQFIDNIPAHAANLMEAFWPGPLTIILPVEEYFAKNVTAGLNTVGIRIPDHPVGRALLEKANIPVAAPSANRSGRPSPTSAAHVMTDLEGRIDGVVDGGVTGVGVESTVIDCSLVIPMILRPGGITRTEIEHVIGRVDVAEQVGETEAPRSPGMKYKHYAPSTAIWLVRNLDDMKNCAAELEGEDKKVGYLVSEEQAAHVGFEDSFLLGSRADLRAVTQNLYQKLREIDDYDYDVILAETFSKEGIGEALMNRLERAASEMK